MAFRDASHCGRATEAFYISVSTCSSFRFIEFACGVGLIVSTSSCDAEGLSRSVPKGLATFAHTPADELLSARGHVVDVADDVANNLINAATRCVRVRELPESPSPWLPYPGRSNSPRPHPREVQQNAASRKHVGDRTAESDDQGSNSDAKGRAEGEVRSREVGTMPTGIADTRSEE